MRRLRPRRERQPSDTGTRCNRRPSPWRTGASDFSGGDRRRRESRRQRESLSAICRDSRAGRERTGARWCAAVAVAPAAAARVSADDGAGCVVSAAPRGAAAIAPPAVTRPIQPAIPGEVRRPPHSEVGISAPTPQPRRGNPRPAHAHAVDVLIRRRRAVGSLHDVLLAVRHPDPAVLVRVDPLARLLRRRGRRRRSGCGLLQDAHLIAVRCRRRRGGRRRGGLHARLRVRRLRHLHVLRIRRRRRPFGLRRRDRRKEQQGEDENGELPHDGPLSQCRYQSRLSRTP